MASDLINHVRFNMPTARRFRAADAAGAARRWGPRGAASLWVLLAAPAVADYDTFLNNGSTSNRVDIVFVGDGYTASELDTYEDHIDAMMDHLFDAGEDPFPRYNNYFNAHRVDVVSNQSGADDPSENHYVDTALNASYAHNGGPQRLLYFSNSRANTAINDALDGDFTPDIRMGTVNSTQYGGGGGNYAVYAGGNSSAPEIALHELGHSFAGLADEYTYGNDGPYAGGEPWEPNVTTDPAGDKWSQWIGYNQPGIGTIGAYEGARYHEEGIYRPSDDSKMRSLGNPFDAVSREEIILDIYLIVDPLDGWLSTSGVQVDPENLWVDPIDPTTIDHEWFVDGELVVGAADSTFDPRDFGFGPGTYEVTAHSYDPTDWVRTHLELLEQDVTWTVTLSQVTDINGDGFVGLEDLDVIVANWGDHVGTWNTAAGDLSGDGLVDQADLDLVIAHWGEGDPPGSTIPEPGTLALLGLGLLAMRRRRLVSGDRA